MAEFRVLPVPESGKVGYTYVHGITPRPGQTNILSGHAGPVTFISSLNAGPMVGSIAPGVPMAGGSLLSCSNAEKPLNEDILVNKYYCQWSSSEKS